MSKGKSKIDPAEFRIPAQDDGGQSELVSFRCPPDWVEHLEKTLTSSQFPYRSRGDLVRHALARHIDWLNGLQQSASVPSRVVLMQEILREEQDALDYCHIFSKLKEVVAGILAGPGGMEEARRLVRDIWKHIQKMTPGYWQTRYSQELQAKFGEFFDAAEQELDR